MTAGTPSLLEQADMLLMAEQTTEEKGAKAFTLETTRAGGQERALRVAQQGAIGDDVRAKRARQEIRPGTVLKGEEFSPSSEAPGAAQVTEPEGLRTSAASSTGAGSHGTCPQAPTIEEFKEIMRAKKARWRAALGRD